MKSFLIFHIFLLTDIEYALLKWFFVVLKFVFYKLNYIILEDKMNHLRYLYLNHTEDDNFYKFLLSDEEQIIK